MEAILKIKMIAHDPELTEMDTESLTEFIIETLNNEFRKDSLEFEKA